MRIFIDTHYFISVITQKTYHVTPQQTWYSCQVMALIHGNDTYPAHITDSQFNIVSCIVHNKTVNCDGISLFTETNKICKDLDEVAKFHLQCLLELQLHNSFSLEDNEKWDRIAEETSIINEMEDEFEDAIDNDINNIAGYLFDQDCGDR